MRGDAAVSGEWGDMADSLRRGFPGTVCSVRLWSGYLRPRTMRIQGYLKVGRLVVRLDHAVGGDEGDLILQVLHLLV